MKLYFSKCNSKKRCLHLTGIHRPPSSSFETVIDIISSELDKIATPNNPVVMKGDINLDSLVESKEKRNLDKML